MNRVKFFNVFLVCVMITTLVMPSSMALAEGDGEAADAVAPTVDRVVSEDATNNEVGDVQSRDFVTTADGIVFDKSTGTIMDYVGSTITLDIPSEIDGIPVIGIDNCAFYCHGNINSPTTISIPSSITNIHDLAFSGASELINILVSENNQYYKSNNGILYNFDYTTLMYYPSGRSNATFTVPEYVKTIGSYAFHESILETINIPEGVEKISNSAFYSCSNLACIEIPSTIMVIEEKAFDCNNYSLKSFHVNEHNKVYKSVDGVLFSKDMKELIRFPEAHSLAEYNIPTTVESINDYAFHACYELLSIDIPDNVLYIGEYAFAMTNIRNVNLPPHITIIEHGLFCGSMVEQISIPEGVTQIGNEAFMMCEFTEIAIPSTVKKIGNYAFSDCSNLASMIIPHNVKDIGMGAFAWCNRLTTILIPASVEYIGSKAFAESFNVSITGAKNSYAESYANNNNITFIPLSNTTNITPFTSTSDNTLKLAMGETGYISYKLRDENNLVSPNDFIYFYYEDYYGLEPDELIRVSANDKGVIQIPFTTSYKRGSGNYTIGFKNTEDGETIATFSFDVEVYDPFTEETNITAYDISSVTIVDSESLDPVVNAQVQIRAASGDGFVGYTTDEYGQIVLNVDSNTIYVGPEASDDYDVIELKVEENGYITWSDKYYRLYRYKPNMIYLRKPTGTDVDRLESVSVSVDNINSNALENRIYINNASTDDVWFSINLMNEFDEPIRYELVQNNAVIYSSESRQFTINNRSVFLEDTKLFLRLAYADGYSTQPINLNMQIYKLEEDTNFKLSPADDITVGSSSDLFNGSVSLDIAGLNFKAMKKSNTTTYIIGVGSDVVLGEENVRGFKRDVLDFLSNSERFYKDTKKTANSAFKTFGEWQPEGTILGFYEVTKVNGVVIKETSGFILMYEQSLKVDIPIMIGPVPTVVGEEIIFGLKAKGDLFQDGDWVVPNGYISLSAGVNLSWGVGFAKVASAGIYGECAIEWTIQSPSKEHSAYLIGELGVYADICSARFTYPFTNDDFKTVLWETDGFVQSKSIYNTGSYAFFDRTSNNPQIAPRALDDITTIKNNVFLNSTPTMVQSNGYKVLVWTDDDPSRTDINRTQLYYSYTPQDSYEWSAPQTVGDDGTSDFFPMLAGDDTNLYLVWQNVKQVLPDNAVLDDILANSEINITAFNFETMTFNSGAPLTNNDILDMQPKITVNNNYVDVVWVSNNENDIWGVNGTNAIQRWNYDGSATMTDETITGDVNAINSISVGMLNGELTVAYVEDADNNFNTIEDKQIKLYSSNGSTTIGDGISISSNPVFTHYNRKDVMMWYDDGNIAYINQQGGEVSWLFQENIEGLTDRFIVNHGQDDEMYISWFKYDGATGIEGIKYDPIHGWSQPYEIINPERKVAQYTSIQNDDNTLAIAMTDSMYVGEDEISNLYIKEYIPPTDIAIQSAYYDIDSRIISNKVLPISIEVKNAGGTVIDSFFIDVSLNKAGTTQNFIIDDVTLLQGETRSLNLKYIIPSTVSGDTLRVTVSTEDDSQSNNNISEDILFGYTDVGIDVEEKIIDATYYQIATVTNSTSNVCNATLNIYQGVDNQGELVKSHLIENIQPETSYMQTYAIDMLDLYFEDGICTYYYELIADETEYALGDNTESIIISEEIKPEDNRIYITDIDLIEESIELDVNGSIQLSVPIIVPSNYTEEITWHVMNPNIVTLNNNTVTGIKRGSTIIIVRNRNGDISDFISIKVSGLDLNVDGNINLLDLILLAQNYNTPNESLDVRDDGIINLFDLILLANEIDS